ncbi:hypothetical protein [Solwaraspora sp. WMMA2080]|uniref:hypothetical protein n=1 Tax=Solwaraspora sp. WMMA2080 TaxID=3015165 RepID=UPI0032B29023
MGQTAHRRAARPAKGGRTRRAVIAVATLSAFGVLIAVSQISSAGTDRKASEQVNGLDVLGTGCDDSSLELHDGFQVGSRCVSTAFGEVGAAEQNPTLLITESPESVGVGEPFQLRVSTRNLVRDRFLPAAQGGYYVESALLTGDGLTRGHFHTACRMLTSTTEALDPEPVPAFFVATEDGGGGAEPDVVTIQVPGLPQEGIAQCASWAGDGSHRIPMMQRANQTPAIDAVRIEVRAGRAEEPPAEEPPAEEPPAEEPPAEEPPAEEPPAEEPPAEEPPAEEPPAEEPPAEEPPAEEPPAEEPPVEETPAPASPEAEVTDDPAPPTQEAKPTPEPTETAAGEEKEAEPTAQPSADPSPTAAAAAGGINAPAVDNLANEADADESASPLALTGANTMNFLVVGLVLIVGGVILVHLTQRRRYPNRKR